MNVLPFNEQKKRKGIKKQKLGKLKHFSELYAEFTVACTTILISTSRPRFDFIKVWRIGQKNITKLKMTLQTHKHKVWNEMPCFLILKNFLMLFYFNSLLKNTKIKKWQNES